jgi:hypothetical protein
LRGRRAAGMGYAIRLVLPADGWRKLVGVEPTAALARRTLVLKTRPSTGQD